jgi:hypothetical protein
VSPCAGEGTEGDFVYAGLAAEVDKAKLQFVGDASTLRPFGSFLWWKNNLLCFATELIVRSTIVQVMIAILHTCRFWCHPSAAALLYGFSIKARDYDAIQYSFSTVYFTCSAFLLDTSGSPCILATDCLKRQEWSLMGRRKVGRDTITTSRLTPSVGKASSLQRFKVNRLNLLDFLAAYDGDLFPFERRWKDCCLYPSGADPVMPEPDLVTMGDNCVVDCASSVISTRGNFELVKIANGEGVHSPHSIAYPTGCVHGRLALEESVAMTEK